MKKIVINLDEVDFGTKEILIIFAVITVAFLVTLYHMNYFNKNLIPASDTTENTNNNAPKKEDTNNDYIDNSQLIDSLFVD